jgi:hypothetical protein
VPKHGPKKALPLSAGPLPRGSTRRPDRQDGGYEKMKDFVEWLTLVIVMSAIYMATAYAFIL